MKLNRKTLLFVGLAAVVGLAVFAPPPDGSVGPTTASTTARNTKGADTSAPARVAAKNESLSDNNSRPVMWGST